MPYTPIVIDSFGGSKTAADPLEVGPNNAIDGFDFDIAHDGALVLPPNTLTQTSSSTSLGTRIRSFNGTAYTSQRVWNLAGLTSSSWAANDATDFQAAGGTEIIYIAAPGRTLKKYTVATTTLSAAIVGTPQCEMLAAMPVSGRLVAARVTGNDLSFVQFSNAPTEAAPTAVETWGANDYVRLSPGDGEQIMAMVAWDSSLYIFKQTKVFAVTGEGIGANGNPIFYVRMLNTGGIGCVSKFGACAGPDGVYFVSKDGIYVTSGDRPVCVSDDIADLFPLGIGTMGTTAFTGGKFSDTSTMRLAYYGQRLYLAAPMTGGPIANQVQYLWVCDMRRRAWMMWSPAAVDIVADPAGGVAYTKDSGVAGASRYALEQLDLSSGYTSRVSTRFKYVSGVVAPGGDSQSTCREAIVYGKGKFGFDVRADLASNTVTDVTAALSNTGRFRTARQGTYLGFAATNALVPAAPDNFEINRVVLHVRDRRTEGSET